MESRHEPRYHSRGEAVVVSVLNSPQECRGSGTLLNISKSGFSVALQLPLAPGTEVLVVLNRLGIFGTVRRCQGSEGEGFTIGAEITCLELNGEVAA